MLMFRAWWWRMNWYNASDNVNHWLARHLPGRLVYWCVIVASVRVIADTESPTDVTVADVLKRMDKI